MPLMHYTPDFQQDIVRLYRNTFSASEGAEEGELIAQTALDIVTTAQPNDFYGFVAKDETTDEITACILWTRLTYPSPSTANVFIMAPVAVSTDHQGKGIGQALIQYALSELKKDGIDIAMTYGDPAFYTKMGFKVVDESKLRSPLPLEFPEGWLAQPLQQEELPQLLEKPTCVEAMNKQELW